MDGMKIHHYVILYPLMVKKKKQGPVEFFPSSSFREIIIKRTCQAQTSLPNKLMSYSGAGRVKKISWHGYLQAILIFGSQYSGYSLTHPSTCSSYVTKPALKYVCVCVVVHKRRCIRRFCSKSISLNPHIK